MEETKERVKAQSAASTEVATGSRELGDQIERLMAALTRVEQGSCPVSAPNSLRHRGHGRGRADRGTPTCSWSHNGQTGLGQTASVHSSSAASRESTDSQRRGNIQMQNGAQGGAQSTRDFQLIAMLQNPGLGSHGKRVHHSSQNVKLGWQTQGNVVKPPSSNNQ